MRRIISQHSSSVPVFLCVLLIPAVGLTQGTSTEVASATSDPIYSNVISQRTLTPAETLQSNSFWIEQNIEDISAAVVETMYAVSTAEQNARDSDAILTHNSSLLNQLDYAVVAFLDEELSDTSKFYFVVRKMHAIISADNTLANKPDNATFDLIFEVFRFDLKGDIYRFVDNYEKLADADKARFYDFVVYVAEYVSTPGRLNKTDHQILSDFLAAHVGGTVRARYSNKNP